MIGSDYADYSAHSGARTQRSGARSKENEGSEFTIVTSSSESPFSCSAKRCSAQRCSCSAKRCSKCGSRKPCSSTDQSNPARTDNSIAHIDPRLAASFEHEHEHRCAEHEHEPRCQPFNLIKTQWFEPRIPSLISNYACRVIRARARFPIEAFNN